jgi:hypothetical protein
MRWGSTIIITVNGLIVAMERSEAEDAGLAWM